MLKAIVMDFDGIVIDTEVVWYEILKNGLKRSKITTFLSRSFYSVSDLMWTIYSVN